MKKEGNIKLDVKSYQKYRIKLEDEKAVPLEMNGQKVNSFIQPVTENDTPKLYVVKSESEVIYVGKALQSIERRLTQGLKAKGEHGYHGYKWKHLSEVDILIWCFTKESHVRIEAIEAELVYLIRKNTGKWPKYQMEIHFHDTSDAESQIAEAIFKELYRLCVEKWKNQKLTRISLYE